MASAPTSGPTPTPAARRRESPQELAARVLVAVLACSGAALMAVAGFEFLSYRTTGLTGQRVLIALGMLAAAALGQALRRTRSPRAASVVALVVAMATLAFHALQIGLGVHTLSLVAATLAIVLAGALAGSGAAWLLTALYLLAVAVLGLLEARGVIPGQAAPVRVMLADRLMAHALVATTALLAALLIHRIVGAALRQALGEEERLSRLVHAAHNWAWEADEQFHITSLSDEFESLSGHRREDFLRMGEPGGAQLVRDADYQLLLDDVRARRPYRDRVNAFQVADGRLLWTLTSGEPVFDASGRHTGWRGVSHNITGERLALQQHQRTASILDRVLRASPDAICVARLSDGRILFANDGFCKLVARGRDELIGRSARELGLWPDRAEPQRMAAALAGSGLVRDLRSGVLVGGRWRDLLVSAATLDWEGETATVLISRDITERERARIEAEAILDHASVGIALTRGARFERVNRHWQEIFGGSEPHLADGSHALPAPHDLAHTALAFERDCLRADGERITVRFSARGLPDPVARRPGAGPVDAATLWLAEDVTERRRQERELHAAKLQAEAASRAKSAFLATMSHEIRTPLNGVVGLARLLQQPDVSDARRAQYLAHLARAAESLNEIVSNVLDLSKMEAGHLALERIEFDLHALAQASFEGSAALGRERGLDMRIDLAPDLPRLVAGDPLRVRQIMANFLNNALKFTERGHIRLALSTAGPGRVRVAVDDSGIGVPPALQPRLFHPFAQADDSTTRRFGGTGLGLSICRELAQRMDGQVGMASDGTHGATFWAELSLPATSAAAEAPAGAVHPAPRHPLAGQRLLVAEDNPVNRLIIGALLQRLGAEVLEAEDGEQAVALARAQAGRLDAVLMDLHMPKIDGLRATELLRADPATAQLPIHAITAAVLEQERHAALSAGMNGFIAKPVAEAEVIRVLGKA